MLTSNRFEVFADLCTDPDISTQLIADSSPLLPSPPPAVAGYRDFAASPGSVVAPIAVDCVTADASNSSATPPTNLVEGEIKTDNFSNTSNVPLLSFTAKTCLQLLPLLEHDQINFEFNLFNKLSGNSFENTKDLTIDNKREFLKNQLINNLSSEFENVVNNVCCPLNFTPTTQSLFARDEVHTSSMRADVDSSQPATAGLLTPSRRRTLPFIHETRRSTSSQPSAPAGNKQLSDPVRVLDNLNFNNISVDDVLNSLELKKEGARQIAYFGSRPYIYGKFEHPPQAYPDTPFFANIFEGIAKIDPSFNTTNFSCMVNYYANGKSFINQHSDNEWAIKNDSTIYTVSLGAPRTIKFINQKGPLDIRSVKLENGCVTSMSAKSQRDWTHGIESEPEINEPRISLTFRHMSGDPRPPRPRAPPVLRSSARPISGQSTTSRAPPIQNETKPSRILFLSDSILGGCQSNIFNVISNHTCIKKMNYELTNFDNFSDEFRYSDIVVLSGGINDIARKGHSAASLAEAVFPKLENCSKNFPRTKFVVNSIILTKQGHINENSIKYNRYLYDFCKQHENLIFFDSHHFMMENSHKLEGQVYDRHDANGIHITPQACRLISSQLVGYVQRTCTSSHPRHSSALVGRHLFRS